MIGFDLAQTFYVDKDAVRGADTVFVTSVDLYFQAKPVEGKTRTGIRKPGVSVYLSTVNDDGSPTLLVSQIYGARVEYDNIAVSTTGATATNFAFRQPIPLPTARSYALLLKFDGSDDDFKIWYNKAGRTTTGQSTTSQVASGKVDGNFFKITNGKEMTPERDADLTFKLNVAKFTTQNQSYKIKNRPYEILKVSSQSGNFKGGEDAYINAANATGTITVTTSSKTVSGTGTTFSMAEGDKIVLTDGTIGNTIVRTVSTVTNTTSIVLDSYPSFSNASAHYFSTVTGKVYSSNKISDYLILQDVTSNSISYITAGNSVRGVDSQASATVANVENFGVNAFIPSFNVEVPTGTTATATVSFANSTYGIPTETTSSLGERQFITTYAPRVVSRSTEVTEQDDTFFSFNATLNFQSDNPYTSPYVREENLDLFVERFLINNDATNEYTGNGNAQSRSVSQIINLADDQRAEDLKVYVRAYKPAGSSIKLYVKMRNSDDPETNDVKDWTELTLTKDITSNPANINDRVDLEYTVPFFNSGTKASGTFTSGSSALVNGTSGSVSTDIPVNSVVRLYSPSIANVYLVDTVVASNSSSFTLRRSISNTSLQGTGFYADVISRPNSGFLDVQNENVFTYYNKALSRFEGYDSFAVKIVMLSNNNVQVPFVDDLRAIAVSA